jgi:putative ABC transport system permease protein
VLIRVRPGAAGVVAREAPFAISAARPHQFVARVPPAPWRLAGQVDRALGGAFTVVGWLGLVMSGLVIATTTIIGVLNRAAEFGLRRAVGARRRHIAAQVLAESAILGLIGGLAGASLGVAVVVFVARTRHWVPVIEPTTVLYAPLVAAAAGMVAGLLGCVPGALTAPAKTLNAISLD